MFEQRAGYRLLCEDSRPLPVGTSTLAGAGDEIRRGSQFVHGVFRSLGNIPGGLVRFTPASQETFRRLMHLGLVTVWVMVFHPRTRER